MEPIITLNDYLRQGAEKCFTVPDYQRGYVWGKRRNDGRSDSSTHLMDTLLSKFQHDSSSDVFLQGVTVSENVDEIILIDGQQRTTFLYLLLKYLGYKGNFAIRYAIRKESEDFLTNIEDNLCVEASEDEPFQDLYYFKKSLAIIREKLNNSGLLAEKIRKEFLEYLLTHIKFLFISIPESQAIKVFTMMNGNRAKMLEQEIIKSEILRLASYTKGEISIQEEWELNALRSRYAREWDKWLHWWNNEDVKFIFQTDWQLGWLLTAATGESRKDNITFDSFCSDLFGRDHSPSKAKAVFDLLRKTQKRFEEVYYNPIKYNRIGAIVRLLDKDNLVKFIKYYFQTNIPDDNLNDYYLLAFLGLTHAQIIKKSTEEIKDKFIAKFEMLKSADVYNTDGKAEAYILLLRLNIDEDNLQNNGSGRKFDFHIWDKNKWSLEHIKAKSTVYHIDGDVIKRGDDTVITEDDIALMTNRTDLGRITNPLDNTEELDVTEHCLGNLVLIYRDDNSSFGLSSFDEKKNMFLLGTDNERKKIFKSRHLMHSIYRFAENSWEGEQIRKHFKDTLSAFISTYSPYLLQKDEEQD